MNTNYDVETMLNETERKIVRQNESVDSIKNHAKTLFGGLSIFLPIFSSVQLFSGKENEIPCIYLISIALMGVGYVWLLILMLKILSPDKYYGPIIMEKERLSEAFMNKQEREVILMKFSANLNAIRLNIPTLLRKHKMLKQANIIFAITIILAIIASIF